MFKKIICLILLFAATIPFYRSHIFFLNFVDEDDNLVIGGLAAKGERLYTDVFTQHQPIQFALSAGIQKLTHPDNILMVVKRHREFVIVWSAVWLIFLTFRFGWPLFWTGAIFELAKIVLLGNMFLAEGFVVYPLLYLISYLMSNDHYQFDRETWAIILTGWFIWFDLAPLWPLLGFLFAWLYLHSASKTKLLLASLTLGAVLTFVLSRYSSLRDYWLDSIVINYQYYIPATTPIGLPQSLLKALFAPIFALVAGGSSSLLLLLKALSLGLLFNLTWLLKSKSYQRVCFLVIVLWLSSLRYIEPGNTLYGAFHMLPWFGLLILTFFYTMPKKFIAVLIFVLIALATINIAKTNLWDQRDLATDYYIHYSPSEDLSKAVSILSEQGGQTVWVEPVMYWVYWQTGARQYNSMVNYYAWMNQATPLRAQLTASLGGELPTLIYLDGESLSMTNYLGEYVPVMRDGKPTGLYLRQDKINQITPHQLLELEYYRFNIVKRDL